MSWTTEPISKRCEVYICSNLQCGQPATHAYPSAKSGWMALCDRHAKKHYGYAKPLKDLLAKGERMDFR